MLLRSTFTTTISISSKDEETLEKIKNLMAKGLWKPKEIFIAGINVMFEKK